MAACWDGEGFGRTAPKEVCVNQKRINTIVFWSGLGLLALLGGLAIWLVTPYGAGIYYDSLEYVAAARNLVAGLGLVRLTCDSVEPITRYPPLYSLFLSAFELLGSNSLSGARFLDIVCMAGTVILTGLMTLRISRNKFFAIFAALAVCISPVIIENYSWVMSEALYMPFMLTSILVFDYYLTNDSLKFLVLSAVLASLAILTRFIGMALVASCILVLVVQLKSKYRLLDNRFIKPLGLYCAITLLPLALWLLRSRLLSGSATSRTLGWYLPSPSRILPLAYVAKWFVPWNGNLSWNWKAVLILAVLSILFVLLCIKLTKSIKTSSLLKIIIANIVIYLGLVLLLMAVADPSTPLNDRILLPVYILMLILIISGIAHLWDLSHGMYKAVAIMLMAYILVFQSFRSVSLFKDLQADGQFYASSYWQNSEVTRTLLTLKPQKIYTNDMTAVYFGMYEPSCIIPLENNQNGINDFVAAIRNDPSIVIAVYNKTMSGFVKPDSFSSGLKAIPLSDGAIYIH